MRKRPAALTCVGLVGGAAALALATVGPTEGCTTHQCDASSYPYYGGHMLDPLTYETNDVNATWLDYRGMTTIQIWFPPEVFGLTLENITVYTGLDPTPNGGDAFVDGDIYAMGAGQTAVYNSFNTTPARGTDGGPTLKVIDGASFGGSLDVTNNSCAVYFARIVVTFAHPTEPVAEASVANVSAEAGLPDAGGD